MRQTSRRICARTTPPRRGESGMVLAVALMLTVLILILGLAFLQTSSAESLIATRDVQRLQASAAAEYGMARARAMAESSTNSHGQWYTMTYNGGYLTWNTSSSYSGNNITTLFSNQAVPSCPAAKYTVVIEDFTDSGISNGTFRMHSYGTIGAFTRHLTMDSQALTYASFGWLTDSENGVYFTTGDSLSGLIYSNDQFNINGAPIFNGHVSTGAASFNYRNGGPPTDNPVLNQGVTYNAPALDTSALMSGGNITSIKSAADAGGIDLGTNSGRPFQVTFASDGKVTIKKKNSLGNWVNTSPTYNGTALSSINGGQVAIYAQEDVQISGVLKGQVTLATSSGCDIQVMDNLTYAYPSNPATMFNAGFNQSDPHLTDKLALLSGGDLVINKTWSGGWTDMYVTASCCSVTGSFRNQYYTTGPQKTLHLYGGIAQATRGAVGQIGTAGFFKDYHFDTRFTLAPPPFLPTIGAQFSNWQMY